MTCITYKLHTLYTLHTLHTNYIHYILLRFLHLTCPLSEVPYDSLSPSFNIQPLAEIEDTSLVILNEAGFNEESDFLDISDSDSSGSNSDLDADDE